MRKLLLLSFLLPVICFGQLGAEKAKSDSFKVGRGITTGGVNNITIGEETLSYQTYDRNAHGYYGLIKDKPGVDHYSTGKTIMPEGIVLKPGESITIIAANCPVCPPPIVIRDTIKIKETVVFRDTVWMCPPTVPPANPPTNPPSTGQRNNLVFEALFNGSNPFPAASLYRQACCSYSTGQSKAIVREGDGSFRAEVKGSDPSSSSGYRSEFIPPTTTRLTDGWYGYSTYFENWNACTSCGEHVIQWHPASGSGSANLGIYTEKNTFRVGLNADGNESAEKTLASSMKIESGKWYDFVWHVVWSSDQSKGRIELWINGTKYVNYTGVTLTTGGIPYFKFGINRWNISGVNRLLYYDNLRIGNEKATYADVAP